MNPHEKYSQEQIVRTFDSIRRLDGRGCLYEMEASYDYYAFEKDFEKVCFRTGCSTFVTPTPQGETLLCHNYDFMHYPRGKEGLTDSLTGLDVIIRGRNPAAKYESVAVADAFWLDSVGSSFVEGVLDDGKTDLSPAVVMPFACMDGLNTEGLAVGIMALPPDGDWQPVDYVPYEELEDGVKKTTVLLNREAMRPWRDTGEVNHGTLAFNTQEKLGWRFVQRPTAEQKTPGLPVRGHTVLMRYILDFCATVEEAIELARSTNIRAPLPFLNFHIMVADRSGRSVILEWVDGQLRVNDTDHATNFYVTRRGSRAHGGDRDAVLEAALLRWPNGMPEYAAKGTLMAAAADLPHTKVGALTYWSAIYNLQQGSMKLWHMVDFDTCYEYRL